MRCLMSGFAFGPLSAGWTIEAVNDTTGGISSIFDCCNYNYSISITNWLYGRVKQNKVKGIKKYNFLKKVLRVTFFVDYDVIIEPAIFNHLSSTEQYTFLISSCFDSVVVVAVAATWSIAYSFVVVVVWNDSCDSIEIYFWKWVRSDVMIAIDP